LSSNWAGKQTRFVIYILSTGAKDYMRYRYLIYDVNNCAWAVASIFFSKSPFPI